MTVSLNDHAGCPLVLEVIKCSIVVLVIRLKVVVRVSQVNCDMEKRW